METKVMRITPPMAREWLKKNKDNRPLRPTKVEGLKLAFQRGEYVPTHQGVAFLRDGTLADGQHRLTAIAEMPDNFGVEMMVTRGLMPEAQRVMDLNTPRSASDILRRHQGLVAVARYMAKMVEPHRQAITPTFLLPFVNAVDEQFTSLLDYCPTVSKTWSAASIRTAAILRMVGGDRDYILLSYHALNHADFESMTPRIQALYRQAVRGSVNSSSLDIFARAYRAFDVRGQKVPTIQITDQANVIAEAKEVIQFLISGTKKKAPASGAKKVNTSNSKVRATA